MLHLKLLFVLLMHTFTLEHSQCLSHAATKMVTFVNKVTERNESGDQVSDYAYRMSANAISHKNLNMYSSGHYMQMNVPGTCTCMYVHVAGLDKISLGCIEVFFVFLSLGIPFSLMAMTVEMITGSPTHHLLEEDQEGVPSTMGKNLSEQ